MRHCCERSVIANPNELVHERGIECPIGRASRLNARFDDREEKRADESRLAGTRVQLSELAVREEPTSDARPSRRRAPALG